jgi:hypothetical protein
VRAVPLLLVPLALAACGGSARTAARTVTFKTGGAFPTETIVGHYSVRNCTHDAATVADNAREFYRHSTVGPGPADLYFYDTRFALAHFTADGCTSGQLGTALERGLTVRQQRFLLAHLSTGLAQPFRAALKAVGAG